MSQINNKYQKLKRKKKRNILLNTVCLAMVIAGIIWITNYFWEYINYEVTNDAYIDQYITPINVRIGGYIDTINFTEHKYVHANDTMLRIDEREYKIKLYDAEASLMDAIAAKEVLLSSIETSRLNISIHDANIAETQARLTQLDKDYQRYKNLVEDESVTKHQFEQIKSDFEAIQAKQKALLSQKDVAKSQYREMTRRIKSADALIMRKKADVDMACLNLSYCVIKAPYDGYIGRRTLEKGQLVQAGQTLAYLVRSDDKWITANYKETQIPNIFIGQKVKIMVDAIPGKMFKGRIAAISEATGSKYSLIPTDNSAGNFVKVQQRIPVRIEFENITKEDMSKMRAGMMVVTEALKR